MIDPAAVSEEQHQQLLFSWRNLALKAHPELEVLHAIRNEARRSKFEGMKANLAGLSAGLPDLHLPIAKGGYSSLYIELKEPKRKLKTPKLHTCGYLRLGGETDKQIGWIMRLRKWENRVEIAYGWEEARDCILEYLEE